MTWQGNITQDIAELFLEAQQPIIDSVRLFFTEHIRERLAAKNDYQKAYYRKNKVHYQRYFRARYQARKAAA